MIFVKLRDLIAAEEAVEAAEKESHELRHNPNMWSAFESMDNQGRRHLNVSAAQFERQDFADAKVRELQQALMTLRQQFAPCGCNHDDGRVA